MVVKLFNIYKDMDKKQLEAEFDALSDQLMAFLMASKCVSIEVLYDDVNSLKCEYKKLRDINYKDLMN